MKITEARSVTGFEKLEPDEYDDKCECGKAQNRYNAGNYLRTSFEYDEGVYACNKCVIAIAIAKSAGMTIAL